jgi:hypothetical protein
VIGGCGSDVGETFVVSLGRREEGSAVVIVDCRERGLFREKDVPGMKRDRESEGRVRRGGRG